MLFSEMIEKDKWGAYSEYLPVLEAEKQGYIPVSHHGMFPTICGNGDPYEGCGSEVIISVSLNPSNNLTSMMCCNPRCWVKMAYSLDYMFSKFDCKGVGEKSCLKVVRYAHKYFDRPTHLAVFNLSHENYPSDFNGSAFANFIQALRKVANTALTFPDMVSNLAIPGFDTTAKTVFGGISDVRGLVDAIKSAGGFENFLDNYGVRDKKKIFYLSEFATDILYAQEHIFKNLRTLGKIKIPICITGAINVQGVKVPQAQYPELCMTIGTMENGVRLFDVEENSAIETNEFVISDFASGSTKRRIAERRQREEGVKIIYTGEEFINYLKEVVICLKENKPLPERKL